MLSFGKCKYFKSKNMCGRAINPDKVKDYKEILPGDFRLVEGDNQYELNMITELPGSYISYNVAPTSFIHDYVDGI